LSAFIHGFEGLKGSVVECSHSLTVMTESEYLESRKKVLSSVSFMQTTLNSLVATYQILLMTINRCTEYTKTSHGIPLSPTLETINLLETVNAPISCVNELQGRVNVELEIDPKISESIITDRQWIQDNLLCLVGNATKYSKEGTTVKVKVEISALHCSDALNGPGLNRSHFQSSPTSEERVAHEDSNPPQSIRFEVEDTGVGLRFFDERRNFEDFSADEIEEMRKLFNEPDFTKRKEMGGSGLGLHCLANRIEGLRGEYGIRPRKDHSHGAVFWFTIPYVPVSSLKGSLNHSLNSFEHHQTSPAIKWFENEMVLEHALQKKSGVGSVLTSEPEDVSPLVSPIKPSEQNELERISPPLHEPYFPSPTRHPLRVSSSLSTEGPYTATQSARTPKETINIAKSRILVVDDSLPIQKMLKIMLEKNGYEVVTAVNGLEAVQFFQSAMEEKLLSQQLAQQAFDGILMDIQMPVMGGIEAITKIREFERTAYPDDEVIFLRHHLIVAMSAGSDDQTLEAVYKAGADDFLPKPFNLQSFKKILEDYHHKANLKD
jgi:two-component system response regulator (stage 0 sporulation protein F)